MPKISEAHGERRRQQILGAAFTCFARYGYHRTSMDQIVAEAGLSKGALYGYFKGKKDLFLALHDLHYGELRKRLEGAFAEKSVTKRLERGAEIFVSTLRKEYADLSMINLEFWSEAPRRPDLREKFREISSGRIR